MTSDTTELTTRTTPTPRPDRVQLSAVQVAASALASVSAAVIASLFGVAGTVIGAGLVAVVSTTGSAIYSVSMRRTSDQLRRARESLLTARAPEGRRGGTALLDAPPATGIGAGPDEGRLGGRGAARFARRTQTGGGEPRSRWRRGILTVGSRRGLRWPALAGAAVLVFALAIGLMTAFEAVTQKPISALTGHSSSSTTTIGSLTGVSSATPTPSVTPSGRGSRSGSSTGSAQPSASPSSDGSRPTPTPSPQITQAPASPAPQDTGTGSGSSDGTGGTSTNGSPEVLPTP